MLFCSETGHSSLRALLVSWLCVVVFELNDAIYLMWVVLVNVSTFSLLSIFLLLFSGFDRESGIYEEVIIFSLSTETPSLESPYLIKINYLG